MCIVMNALGMYLHPAITLVINNLSSAPYKGCCKLEAIDKMPGGSITEKA